MKLINTEYGYEYSSIDNEDCCLDAPHSLFSNAHMLRSGRDAFKAIACQYSKCTALLPALSCQSMISPFSLFGHKVLFYSLKPDLTADLDSIYRLFSKINNTILFVYMNYFGIKSISDDDLMTIYQHDMVGCKASRNKNNIVMIEDRTHDLFSNESSYFLPDFSLASIRKWIAVPDGALLWIKDDKAPELDSEESFWKSRLCAQKLKSQYHMSMDLSLKSKYREIFSKSSVVLDKGLKPIRISSFSEHIIQHTNFSSVMKKRKSNVDTMIDEMRGSELIKIIQPISGFSDLYVPFLVSNRDEIQKKLSALDIYCTIIWPLSEKQKRTCMVARWIDEHMLAAPCDQRYTEGDMKMIGMIIRSICTKYSS